MPWLSACAASRGRTHPVIPLWPVAIRDALRRAVAEQGIRKVDLSTHAAAARQRNGRQCPSPFFNLNTPEDLAEADRLVALYPDP